MSGDLIARLKAGAERHARFRPGDVTPGHEMRGTYAIQPHGECGAKFLVEYNNAVHQCRRPGTHAPSGHYCECGAHTDGDCGLRYSEANRS